MIGVSIIPKKLLSVVQSLMLGGTLASQLLQERIDVRAKKDDQ